jgi:Tol biopolymer transport system component
VCRYDIYVVAVDGGDPVRLTTDDVSLGPIWSPDSKRLVYLHATMPEAAVAGQGGPSNVRSIELDGTAIAAGAAPVDVTPMTGGVSDYPLGWSRDGSRISFFRGPVAVPDKPSVDPAIWTVASDGSDPRQVVEAGPMTWWDWPPLP